MADEKIYVAFDYNNITIVDPNKVLDENDRPKDRYVKQEDLVIYANLECSVKPRTKLALGTPEDQDAIQTISVAEINFLNPGKKEKLDNQYTNEITGQNSTTGGAVNQNRVERIPQTQKDPAYYRLSRLNQTDNGLLGITQIRIRQSTDFTPQITIDLEDIKGRALFESGPNSPYGSFFHLPYPPFYLTIKGYYGKAVRLTLMLSKFNARYDSLSGNFKVQLDFYTYKYSVLVETPMSHLLAVPYMYPTTITQNGNTGTNTTKGITFTSEKGRQKLEEVYKEYESKGLVSKNFQDYTIKDLHEILSRFIRDTLTDFIENPINFEPLTDIDTFQRNLGRYEGEVLTFGIDEKTKLGAWAEIYLDKKNVYILKGGQKIYYIKSGYNRLTVINQLDGIIKEFNERLNSNKTCGQNGTGYIKKGNNGIPNKSPQKVNNEITIDNIRITTPITSSQVDFAKTYQERTGATSIPREIEDFLNQQFETDTKTKGYKVQNELDPTQSEYKMVWFSFEGNRSDNKKTFSTCIAEMKKKVEIIKKDVEDDITLRLADLLKEQKTLGFVPNIRNILAIFFANAEAFLRLMDDVHQKAWGKNTDKIRINAILNGNPTSDRQKNGEQIIYPWPQLIAKNESTGTYEPKYPGDYTINEKTEAYNFDSWPEVEFVEEYIRALVERVSKDTNQNDGSNEVSDVRRISINAIEFPIKNEVFFKQETTKFIYEIFERLKYTIIYSQIYKGNPNLLSDLISQIEILNITESLRSGTDKDAVNSPSLVAYLKTLNVNKNNYQELLRGISNNGTGRAWNLWIRGEFNTDYIFNQIDSSFTILPNFYLNNSTTKPLIGLDNDIKEKLNNWLTASTNNNEIGFIETYPFTNTKWVKNNLANGASINPKLSFNTNKVIGYQDVYKTLTNFKIKDDTTFNRPITYFFDPNILSTVPDVFDLKNFYNLRKNKYENQLPTEGNLNYDTNYSGLVSNEQTTSIFNTPFFINAIQKGVELQKDKSQYPYIKAAYLFLNSLSLITCKEKLKNKDKSESDYIYATIKKYGALHKLPYAFILKIGSIWHRYKKFIQSNEDILNDIWTDFDYIKNYDPISGDSKTRYQFTADTGNTVTFNIVLQENGLNTSSVVTATTINLGFYPKLINDFHYFHKGSDLIKTTYTSQDIQTIVDSNVLSFYPIDSAKITYPKGVDPNNSNREIKITSWTTIYKDKTNSGEIIIFPSVGIINQTQVECFENANVSTQAKLKNEVFNNVNIYNGSTRLYLSAPNYGYFNVSKVKKPQFNQYLKNILNSESNQENNSINFNENKYSYIDDIFSIFNKDILDFFENEFLNFSKPEYDFNTTLVENKGSGKFPLYNFQLLFRQLTSIYNTQFSVQGVSILPTDQDRRIKSTIDEFLNEDVFFLNGNPSNYNIKLFYSFSNLPLVDKITWEKYTEKTPNSLPFNGGGITLAASQVAYPSAWKALALNVGFSTIDELVYKNNGSYITDFFIDFNVAFTENNIKNFAQIIKLYATQKLNKTNQTPNINTNILLYQANLSNGYVLEINENSTNLVGSVKNFGISIFNKNYNKTETIESIKNDLLSQDIYNGFAVTITEVTYDDTSSTIPQTPNSLANSIGVQVFKDAMDKYLVNLNQDFENVIPLFWSKLQKQLSNFSEKPNKTDLSTLNGDPQTKYELWETFKSLNDKWIAGTDFKSKTLFEDVLLLDRASRNVGDKVLIDIFSLTTLIDPTKIQVSTDVFSFIESVLKLNNFYTMTLPSYVNFYGIQKVSDNPKPKPESTMVFASNLFGTFLNVDYRESSSKLVCMFIDRPSEHINLNGNPDYRFYDDAFDLLKESDNPLSESLDGKTDFDKSNKVVGFNVDIGVQNQQIFKNFSVAQNAGLATTEALEIINQMANQGGGRNVATQNLSLYSIYKNRSYTCNLSMMGNAMIQPTMYFNLRYVPMFSGPYMITEVNHSISQGEFSTDISGIRQPVASLPILSNFLQGLRTNLIKKIDEQVANFAQTNSTAKPTNIINQTTIAGQSLNNSVTIEPTEKCVVTISQYSKFSQTPRSTDKKTLTTSEIKVIITNSINNANYVNDGKLIRVIFSYLYFQSAKNNNIFESDFNNYGGVDLLQEWGSLSTYFEQTPEYFCKLSGSVNLNIINPPQSGPSGTTVVSTTGSSATGTLTTTPYAVFATPQLHARFFVEWWKGRERNIDVNNTNIDILTESVVKFIVINRNPTTIQDDNFYNKFKTNNKTDYDNMLVKVKKALEIFNTLP